jgi:hypothetical protein
VLLINKSLTRRSLVRFAARSLLKSDSTLGPALQHARFVAFFAVCCETVSKADSSSFCDLSTLCYWRRRSDWTPESKNSSFMEHGDVKHKSGSGSSTFRLDPLVNKLVTNKLHPSRDRFAYLKRKWGFDTCGLYHKVLNQWRAQHEIFNATSYAELLEHGAKWALPYNESRTDIKHRVSEDLRSTGVVSSRAVNSSVGAPTHFRMARARLREGTSKYIKALT